MSTQSIIEKNGIIEHIALPDGFSPSDIDRGPHNYLEYQARGSCAMICYEQTSESFIADDISKVDELLNEKLDDKARTLNISGEPGVSPDDSALFDVLCFCFVFGGGITRNGCVMDMDKCKWELRSIANGAESRNVIVGRMKFMDSTGRRSKREVLVVIPQVPSESGCGYLWLEGNASEIRRHENSFLSCVAEARFRKLSVIA